MSLFKRDIVLLNMNKVISLLIVVIILKNLHSTEVPLSFWIHKRYQEAAECVGYTERCWFVGGEINVCACPCVYTAPISIEVQLRWIHTATAPWQGSTTALDCNRLPFFISPRELYCTPNRNRIFRRYPTSSHQYLPTTPAPQGNQTPQGLHKQIQSVKFLLIQWPMPNMLDMGCNRMGVWVNMFYQGHVLCWCVVLRDAGCDLHHLQQPSCRLCSTYRAILTSTGGIRQW